MSFDSAIAYVLANEGIDSNDPADRGGRTRFGVTDHEAAAHGLDVVTLTLDQAKAIYRSDYWLPLFDQIVDQRIATKILDMGVNMGVLTSIRLLQVALGVPSDGVFGPVTLKSVNATAADVLLRELVEVSVRRYIRIVLSNHSQLVFLAGWAERAMRLPPEVA